MSEPKRVDGWNVAELAGGLLLTADEFMVQLNTEQVDHFIEILNGNKGGNLRAANGDRLIVVPKNDHVILKIEGDKKYPDGIILPVDVFSEVDDSVAESVRPTFRRVGTKIKRQGSGAPKPADKKAELVKALKTELVDKQAELRLRRLKD